MPQSFGCLHCHIVFSTKGRRNFITDDLQPRLFAYVGGILHNHDCRLVASGGMPDHVHLLTSLGRAVAVADAVRLIKSNSSKWIHEDLAMPTFRWQEGYGAFSVSHSNIEQVKTYIAHQRLHHHRATFQEEYRDILRRHDIEWDERYVWD